MNLVNMDCVGQDKLCKDNHTPIGVQFKTGDYKEADNESHGGEILCEVFCVTENDLDFIDIEDLY